MYLVSSGAEVVVQTPAKINLFLEVLGKRPDGYHDIDTCMVPVSLWDTLYCRLNHRACRIVQPDDTGVAGPWRLTCHWADGFGTSGSVHIPLDSKNLVIRAVERLWEAARAKGIVIAEELIGLDFRLVKRIPAEAGLGGASSDAAAALMVANHLWRLCWTRDQLAEVASTIGSDVPFFLGVSGDSTCRNSKTFGAICRGRGERISNIATPFRFHAVIVKPPVGLSTAEVYRHCRPASSPRLSDDTVYALAENSAVRLGAALFNRLSEPAAQLSPWIDRIVTGCRHLGVPGVLMSGSGSSVFALCHHRRHAIRVAAQIRSLRYGAVYPVENVPLAFANS